nr:glycosyltransferase family 2 protein [uncultured Desulfobacter sp.]
MREAILKTILKNCPKGDLHSFSKTDKKISCVFIFYQRFDLMAQILHNLNAQDMSKTDFEVVLVEDRGGSEKGCGLVSQFHELDIRYFAPEGGWGKMGAMRNYGLSQARGEICLFLDDDTVIPDPCFLKTLAKLFDTHPECGGIMSHGRASYSLINGRYDFHDPYFFTNRCMAYRKTCLEKLNGFDSGFIGQEDVELAIRFIASGYTALKAECLNYYHPPLVCENSNKARAVGASFAASKYSGIVKCLLFFNGTRWLPLYISPALKHRFMARFAFGFLKGFLGQLFHGQSKQTYQ